jgi:hypothetical protein
MPSPDAATGAARFIAPFVAGMNAVGDASYNYIYQETVSIAGIDYEFDATLTEPDSAKLLNAFTVSGKGTDANFNVALTSVQDFKDVLIACINGKNVATKNGSSAEGRLASDLTDGLLAAIFGDDLINTVQDIAFTNVSVTLDSSGGSANMADGLDVDRCKLIYTQIPWQTRSSYMDASENQTVTALPLIKDDVLTFVFDVNVASVTPGKAQVDVTAATGAPVTSSTVSGQYTSSLSYTLGSKRIAFNLKISAAAANGEVAGLNQA